MFTKMYKIVIVICIIGAVFLGPIWGKTDEEIQEFREFLERIGRYDNATPGETVPLPKDFVRTWVNSGRFQGDILLTDAQIDALVDDFSEALAPRVAVSSPFQLWPNNEVIYQFAPGHHTATEQYEILRAMSEIGIHTCVSFRERTANDNQFVYITSDQPGCSAHVGYPDPNTGYHVMNLEKRSCFYPPIVVHELLHVIGFQHMQCSPERDNYVEIYEQNMINGTQHNFVKLNSLYTTMLNIPYEYGSVMHYPSNAFSKNGLATILPVQNATQEQKDKMGQQNYVTHWDWIRGRRLYNCQGGWQEPIYVPQHENKPAQYYFDNTRL